MLDPRCEGSINIIIYKGKHTNTTEKFHIYKLTDKTNNGTPTTQSPNTPFRQTHPATQEKKNTPANTHRASNTITAPNHNTTQTRKLKIYTEHHINYLSWGFKQTPPVDILQRSKHAALLYITKIFHVAKIYVCIYKYHQCFFKKKF
jgi:hypothetical protein